MRTGLGRLLPDGGARADSRSPRRRLPGTPASTHVRSTTAGRSDGRRLAPQVNPRGVAPADDLGDLSGAAATSPRRLPRSDSAFSPTSPRTEPRSRTTTPVVVRAAQIGTSRRAAPAGVAGPSELTFGRPPRHARPVDLRLSRAAENGLAPVRERSFCFAPEARQRPSLIVPSRCIVYHPRPA